MRASLSAAAPGYCRASGPRASGEGGRAAAEAGDARPAASAARRMSWRSPQRASPSKGRGIGWKGCSRSCSRARARSWRFSVGAIRSARAAAGRRGGPRERRWADRGRSARCTRSKRFGRVLQKVWTRPEGGDGRRQGGDRGGQRRLHRLEALLSIDKIGLDRGVRGAPLRGGLSKAVAAAVLDGGGDTR